ncbi:MAG: flippase-like domain-containing protein, partial [Candidatus Cloacimonetes bacterium]|nr:flippase-like domain-containing protein [Candidatus Cloacimonadota bacterium]
MSDKKKIIIGIAVGIILIIVWMQFINVSEVLSYLKKLNVFYVLIASFLYLLSYFIRSIRWRQILKPVCKLSIKEVYFTWMAGFFLNYLIPIRAGEFAKSYFIKRTKGVPIAKSLPSIFIDKVFDSISIFLVIGLIPFLHVNISKPLLILIFLLIAVFILGAGILIISTTNKPLVVKILTKFFFFIPKKIKTKFFEIIEIFVEGVGLFKHHSKILPSVIGLTIVAVLID